MFWWHTVKLELLIKYNDQWFPVSIPPQQVDYLKEAIYESIGNTRRDIVFNKKDIDTAVDKINLKNLDIDELGLNHPPGEERDDEDDQKALCNH